MMLQSLYSSACRQLVSTSLDVEDAKLSFTTGKYNYTQLVTQRRLAGQNFHYWGTF